ncbi:hypothetical protein Tco_1275518, partial [Tanacetum coccineum]
GDKEVTMQYLVLKGGDRGAYKLLGDVMVMLESCLIGVVLLVKDCRMINLPGQMTYPIASLTLDSARSYVMQGAPFTKGTISSIPIGGNISPEGFLPSILLMVIMVTVVIVAVILVVVVVAIFGVVVIVSGVSFIIKLSFMIIGFLLIIVFYYLLHQPLGYGNGFLQSLRLRSSNISFNTSGWAYAFHQDKAASVRVPVENVTLFSSAQLLRENTDSVRSNQRIRSTAPSVPLKIQPINLEFKTSRDRYGDNRVTSVAADALSKNEQAKPLRVRALVMTIISNLPPQIHEARVESLKKENVKDENLHGMDKEFENCLDGTLCIRMRSWLPRVRDLGELVQHVSHKPNYFIHPGIG